jgi:hypothetical protein
MRCAGSPAMTSPEQDEGRLKDRRLRNRARKRALAWLAVRYRQDYLKLLDKALREIRAEEGE